MAARQAVSGLCALPDELLQRIFNNFTQPGGHAGNQYCDQRALAHVAATCRRFNEVLRQPLRLYSSLMITQDPLSFLLRPTSPSLMRKHVSCFSGWAGPRQAAVRKLHLAGEHRSYLADMLILAPLAANLRILHIEFAISTVTRDPDITRVRRHPSEVDGERLGVEAQLLLDSVAGCTQLTELVIELKHPWAWESRLSQPLSMACLRSLPKLQSLRVITRYHVPSFDVVPQLPRTCPGLQFLSCTPTRDNLTGLSSLTGLQELHLQQAHESSPHHRWQLSCLNGLSALTKLSLSGARDVPAVLPLQLPSLQSLELYGCKFPALRQLQGIECLEHLVASGCLIPHLDKVLPALSCLTSLKLDDESDRYGYGASAPSSLPASISDLTDLRDLRYDANDARSLPVLATLNLTCLTRLVVTERRVNRHSPFLLHLTMLTHLSTLQLLHLSFKRVHVLGSVEDMIEQMHQLVNLKIQKGGDGEGDIFYSRDIPA